MNRRRFVTSSGAAAARIAAKPVMAAPSKPVLMKLGCQSVPTNDTHLKYFARYGVRNICGYPEIADSRIYATVDADAAWERITYFLDRVIPVAAEYKIRIACHPHDPGVPPEGYQGVARVLGTVDGLKRFVGIKENPYHGLNFC